MGAPTMETQKSSIYFAYDVYDQISLIALGAMSILLFASTTGVPQPSGSFWRITASAFGALFLIMFIMLLFVGIAQANEIQ